MRKSILTTSLIAAVSGLITAVHAQSIVIASDNFDADPLGAYGAVAWNFSGAGVGDPEVNIVTDNPEGTNTQNCAFTFASAPGTIINFGWRSAWLTATGNTAIPASDYTLEFDMAVQGVNMNQLGGYVGPTVGLFGDYGGIYYKENGFTNMAPSAFPPAGTGYQHYSIPVGALAKVGGSSLVNPTDNPLCFVIGLYAPGLTYTGTEEIDIANLQITMLTNAAPPPPPTLSVLPTTPELRVFAQNSQETYNQEGFGTVDDNQSWVGSATSTTPVSYSVSFKDFNTVNGFSFYYEMAGYNTVGVNPYLIYDTPNEFQFTITSQSSGFTWSLDYKTNAPLNGVSVNVASGVTTSTTGVGTWTLTFDSDTNGTVTAVDGSVTPFNLGSEEVATNFANPMNICFGIAPNNPAGFGQYIDISKMVITNVAGANEYSDFTTNTVFDTTQWTAGFSLDAGSVIQVATNTPLWVKWQVPDAGFGLETAPSLATNTTWYLPSYWNGVTLNPLRMGTSNVWVLIPTTCMPTLDGGQGENGAGLSPTSFFKLQNPPTAQ